jgi:hypothetical protein
MRKILSTLFMILVLASQVYAAQSAITDAEGTACMGDDKSRKQAEDAALTDAKRKAVEYASTYVRAETNVKDFVLEKDLVSAYAHATVTIIQELGKTWYKDPSSGDCCRIRIKAEVVPDAEAMAGLGKSAAADDPSAPLNVKVWTDKKEYRNSDKIKVYIKGNKPFYARIIYKDAQGQIVQLLPNPHRTDNYFNGGSIYEIPSGNDAFELEVNPPFGEESIVVYAGSAPLGELGLKADGGVYQVLTKTQDVGTLTRGIKLTEKSTGKTGAVASEFVESSTAVRTGK